MSDPEVNGAPCTCVRALIRKWHVGLAALLNVGSERASIGEGRREGGKEGTWVSRASKQAREEEKEFSQRQKGPDAIRTAAAAVTRKRPFNEGGGWIGCCDSVQD